MHMSIKGVIKRIETEREYNIKKIKEEALFPWTKDIRTIRKIVHKDYWGENMLKALVTGVGRALEYKIKGKNIIKFLEKYGDGLMMASPGQ